MDECILYFSLDTSVKDRAEKSGRQMSDKKFCLYGFCAIGIPGITQLQILTSSPYPANQVNKDTPDNGTNNSTDNCRFVCNGMT